MTKSFKYLSEIQSISSIRNDLEALALHWNIPSPELKQISLIVEELFSNIIRFAFEEDGSQTIELTITRSGARIMLEICDAGIPYNPLEYNPDLQADPASAEDAGMGISLIRAFADTLNYERMEHRNHLFIEKNIRSKPESSEK